METSMLVTDAYTLQPYVLTGKSTDLNGDAWTFELRWGGFYSTEMVDRIFEDLGRGVQPFLTCRYNEARDRYVVVDDYGNEVPLSRFSNWERA